MNSCDPNVEYAWVSGGIWGYTGSMVGATSRGKGLESYVFGGTTCSRVYMGMHMALFTYARPYAVQLFYIIGALGFVHISYREPFGEKQQKQ